MLPRQFNDGRDVPAEWISLAVLEIGDHFGAVSYETQIIEGRWQQAGVNVSRQSRPHRRRYARQEGKPFLDEGIQEAMEREAATT
jgi:hypothetical protein